MPNTTRTSSIPETEITTIMKMNQPKNNPAASKALRGNWKTTAIGITLSFTGFVAFSPSNFGGEEAVLVQFCKYITSGGLAALGVYSKDFNVTGGKKNQ